MLEVKVWRLVVKILHCGDCKKQWLMTGHLLVLAVKQTVEVDCWFHLYLQTPIPVCIHSRRISIIITTMIVNHAHLVLFISKKNVIIINVVVAIII